jgi:hypothetical protein
MSAKGRVVNLDEYRVASGENAKPTVLLGGKTFELPAELPLSISVCLKNGDIEGAVRGLFGSSAKKALDAGLTGKDLDRIAKDAYGLTSGESPASPG